MPSETARLCPAWVNANSRRASESRVRPRKKLAKVGPEIEITMTSNVITSKSSTKVNAWFGVPASAGCARPKLTATACLWVLDALGVPASRRRVDVHPTTELAGETPALPGDAERVTGSLR